MLSYKHYQVGGSLRGSSQSYVTRKADKQLYENLVNGEFCYLLNARQMGKSSLRNSITQKLRKEKVECASVDLSALGHNVSQAEWYKAFAYKLINSFEIDDEVNLNNWQSLGESDKQRFSQFLQKIILQKFQDKKVVIFVEEIDSIIKLSFKDDFFALIRSFYNERAEKSIFENLTFCLIGVAKPTDLIEDAEITPFNIGKGVELTGFTFDECKESLITGLAETVKNPESVLKDVLHWTGGQPFLTQKICSLIVDKSENTHPNIANLVQEYIINNWQEQDNPVHLTTIYKRLLYDENKSGILLGLYQQILEEGQVTIQGFAEEIDLRLSGIVVKKGNYLQVYNPIYQAVFNKEWVQKKLNDLRPYSGAMDLWLKSNQDPSHLLKGKELKQAQEWSVGRRLSEQDYKFITASTQAFAEVKELEIEILSKAKRKAAFFLQGSLTIAVLLLSFTFFLGNQAKKQKERLNFQEQQLQSEIQNSKESKARLLNFSSQFNWESNNQLKALVASIEAGNLLKDIPADSEIYGETVNQLRMILNNIGEMNRFEGHTSFVWDVAFSPDGQMIASASRDNTVKLWSLDGKLLHTFEGHDSRVRSVAFSPNGQMIASAGRDNTIKLWSVPEQQLLHSFEGHSDWLEKVVFSPDGQMIASAGRDNTIKLWSVPDKQLLRTLTGHEEWVLDIGFSPDSNTLASGSADSTIKLWNVNNGQLLKTIEAHEYSVTTLAFSPDGRFIASGGGDNFIKVWNVKTGANIKKIEETKGGTIWDSGFSPDGKFILTASNDNIIRIWRWNWERKDLTFADNIISSNNNIQGLAFSPDGKFIALASNDTTIKLWNWRFKRENSKLTDIWRIADLVRTLSKVSDLSKGISFSPDGQRIVTGSNDREIKLWDLDGNLLSTIPASSEDITNAVFSPNKKIIASAGVDRTITLWTLNEEEINKINVLKGHDDVINHIAFSPNGSLIASASWDDTVKIWNVNGNLLTTIEAHGNDNSLGVSFSPDSQYIVTGGADNLVKLWNLEGELVKTFQGHINVVNSVAFHPSGKTIASAGYDNTIKVWNVDGSLLTNIQAHNDVIENISFSPSGELLASASWDKTVKIWDAQGNLIKTFQGDSYFLRVDFSADGKNLTAIDSNNVVRIWNIENLDLEVDNIESLLKQGCQWIRNYLQNSPSVSENDKKLCNDIVQ